MATIAQYLPTGTSYDNQQIIYGAFLISDITFSILFCTVRNVFPYQNLYLRNLRCKITKWIPDLFQGRICRRIRNQAFRIHNTKDRHRMRIRTLLKGHSPPPPPHHRDRSNAVLTVPLAGRLNWLPPPPPRQASVAPPRARVGRIHTRWWEGSGGSQFRRRDRHNGNLYTVENPK
jgi:hypothetical protein